MFTVKRLAHHLTVKFVKNQSGIHDVLRTHGTNAGLAQLAEPFTCNEKVIRSSRISSSRPPIGVLMPKLRARAPHAKLLTHSNEENEVIKLAKVG